MTGIVYGPVEVNTGEPVLPQWWGTVDRWTLACIFLLALIGLVMALAASPAIAGRNDLDPFYYFYRQAFFALLALASMVVVSIMSIDLLRRLCILGFVAGTAALVLLPFLGTDFGKDATRWYSLGFVSFQPSEFAKPFFIVTAAWFLSAQGVTATVSGTRISFFLAMIMIGLLVVQPDFGQASLFLAAWMLMYFVAGAPVLILFCLAVATVLGGVAAFNSSEHFARRIVGFLDRDPDPNSQAGYVESAIRSGGNFGVGVGEGKIKWTLPDAHTDYIIAVAAEEYGLMLVLLIVLLFLTITVSSLVRIRRRRDMFTRIAGTGLTSIFALQGLINMGVAARLLPAKGMTLPFVSYGGSSILATAFLMGVLLAFTRARPLRDMDSVLGPMDQAVIRAA